MEIAEIPGTGTGGRVTRKDIEGYIEEQEERGAEREEYAPPGLQEEQEILRGAGDRTRPCLTRATASRT